MEEERAHALEVGEEAQEETQARAEAKGRGALAVLLCA
jgi:hypothetical protein